MVLARNENYWGGPFNRGLAPEPNVIIKAGIDLNTRVLDLLSGATDLANFPYEGVDAFPGGTVWQFVNKTTWFSENKLVPLNPDIQVYPQTGLWPELSTAGVTFNQKIMDINGNPQAFQPFADIRIRKAFTLCFNRTSYLQNVLYNFAAAGTQILPSSMFGYDPTIQPTPFDPATAESLLLDAGAHPLTPANAFSPAHPVTLNIAYQLGMAARATVATMITSCINSFSSTTGLTVNSGGVSEPQLVSMRRTHQVQIWFLDWSVDYVDPDDFLVPFASATAGFYPAFTSYNNTEVTKLVAEQASITDPTQRLQVIHQIESLVNQDWQYIWLQKDSTYTISRSWLHERANASIASGVETYNPEMDGYYYYEIVKGPPTSSAAVVTNPFQALYLDLLQTASLPTTRRVF
jgi:ABC-type transport system substrate-binding protein